MPTYEYQCTECKFTFEAFQKINDAALEKCPHCKGKVKRLISAGAGLIFKGSGFYATDYKKRPKETTKPKCTSSESKEKKDKESPDVDKCSLPCKENCPRKES